jgi:hypothetical protein
MNWWRAAWERFWLKFINRQPSPTCQEVLRLLAVPENWVTNEYYMCHKSSRLGIWIANGVDHVKLCLNIENIEAPHSDTKLKLSKRDRRAIWKAINWAPPEQRQLLDLYWELKKHK